MIIHRLIARHLKHRDDEVFYGMQADDAIRWLKEQGVKVEKGVNALDLGCGHGIFGERMEKLGCDVTFSDDGNWLLPRLKDRKFIGVNLDKDEVAGLGTYDLVICSNVLEHLSKPEKFLREMRDALRPGGHLYLSWTNWLSPWGGHEFSPFHYLGPKLGIRVYDRVMKRKRIHTPYVNLFPTYIGEVCDQVHATAGLEVVKIAPRYYTELSFLMHIPLVRELVSWNCAMLIKRV
jgi:SAM-dependent methyltransferase